MKLDSLLLLISLLALTGSAFLGGYMFMNRSESTSEQALFPPTEDGQQEFPAVPEVFLAEGTENQCSLGFNLPAIGAVCTEVQIRDVAGNPVNPDQVTPNQTLYLSVVGTVSNTTLPVQNAHFIINNQTLEATKNATNPNLYQAQYTVPNNITSITIKGEIQNPVDSAWITSAGCTATVGPQLSYQCVDFKVINQSGVEISPASVKPGQVVTLQVSGTTNSVDFTRGEFKIGTQVLQGTKSGANTFQYSNYTVGSTSTPIEASVFHPVANQSFTSASCQETLVPQVYACEDLTGTLAISRGSQLPPVTCKATGNAGIYARFRLLNPQGAALASSDKVNLNSNQAVWTADYTIPANAPAGNYLLQCQVCDNTDACSAWGSAN